MRRILLFCAAVFICFPNAGASFDLVFKGGAGYTMVDLAAINDYSDGDLWSSSRVHWRFGLQGLFGHDGAVAFGVEFGYQRQYYYEFRFFATDYYYVDGTDATITILPLLHFRLGGDFYLQAGGGPYIFTSEGTAFGIFVALGREFTLGESLALLLEVRTDHLFAHAAVQPVVGSLGMRQRL